LTPAWEPEERYQKVYKRVHEHSPGMVSFTCEPLSAQRKNVLDMFRHSRAYEALQTLKNGSETNSGEPDSQGG